MKKKVRIIQSFGFKSQNKNVEDKTVYTCKTNKSNFF